MKASGMQLAAHVMLILLASLVLLYFGQDFLIPLVLGVMAWSLINALADNIGRIPIGKWHMPRWLAMLLSVAALLAALLLIYRIIASQAVAIEAAHLMQKHAIQGLLVIDNAGDLVGALNFQDLLRAGVI